MHPELVHLYGPIAINTFGLCIIIGIIIFSLCLINDQKSVKIISPDQYFNILAIAIITALVGGRLLFVLTNSDALDNWKEMFFFWQGGFSLLGGVLALLIVMPWYFKNHHIPTIAFFDRVAIYAPLLQSISRIGCFFAGCCFGTPIAFSPFLNHPTQLYSASMLLLIFLGMYFIIQAKYAYPGQLLCIYLILISIERFMLDFWRGDREYLSTLTLFSIQQLLALLLAFFSFAGIIYIILLHKRHRHESI